MIRFIAIVVIFLLLPTQIEAADKDGLPASARSTGEGVIVLGTDRYNNENTEAINGSILIKVLNVGDRWSSLMNIDEMSVETTFSTEVAEYRVVINEPMIHHPNGVDPTWFGVAYNQPMHGHSNIGITELPRVQPEIAIWGRATVYKDGISVATRIPAHVMVNEDGPLKGITLQVGLEGEPVSETPDGYLHVHWNKIDQLIMPEKQKKTREWIGLIALLTLNVWFGWLATRERRTKSNKSSSSNDVRG